MMLQWLIWMLTPIFTKMGVSEVDVQTYVNSLSGYIYAIFGSLLLAVAVMVAAHFFAKKGTRHVVRWTAGLSWALVVVVLANVISFGPMYNNLSIILNSKASVSDASLQQSRDVIRQVGDEGMVLLKNDGVLPLSADITTLNVFGWASTAPIFGGTGSGSADTSACIGILQSLEDAGYALNQSLTDLYVSYSDTRSLPEMGNVGYTDWTLPEPTQAAYTDTLMRQAEAFSDVAVVVIARSGGEGQDVPRDMSAVIHGTYDIRDEVASGNSNYNYFNGMYRNNGGYDDFDQGEHYLQLSNTEEAMLEKVCSSFAEVIVVVNANNAMELGWVEEYDSIGAVILAPGTGATGMGALGDILSGAVNPSGKTVDTYVYDLTATPAYHNTGDFSYTNVEALKAELTEADDAYQGNIAFVNYSEGIYVGYKFYETAVEEGLIDYDGVVQYPFGYGLSYTTFEQKLEDFTDDGTAISFDVSVTNTGPVAGKTPVEVYFTPPYLNGGIEKASVNLIDFQKTGLLEPGASETLSFTIPKEDLASYDARGVKTANGGYVLEAGEYVISVRADAHTVLDEATFTVEADLDYSAAGRAGDHTPAVNRFQDYSAGTVTYLSRADGFANYTAATSAPDEAAYEMDGATLALISEKSAAHYDPTLYDHPEDVMPVTGADNGLTLGALTGKDYDDPQWEPLLDQLTVEDMVQMVNLGGFQTVAVKSVGKIATMDSDGTSGLNDWVVGVYGTPFPVEVLISQTWNPKLARETGSAIGAEYADCDIYGWYGPAMNMHRSAFCGRNFEYYAEDSVLAGMIASAEVNGAAEHGVYAYIKHFALNDQETNRCSFLLTYSDEQAMREIYLKPFELCVKNFTGTSLAVMSSFNFIGPVYAGANDDLLSGVLRDEWGFRGMVLSDWDGSYGYQMTDNGVRNGNDCMLGFNSYPTNVITDTDAPTCVLALRRASKNILYTVANSGNYTHRELETGGIDNMTKLFIGIDAAAFAAAALIEGLVLFGYIKKKKDTRRMAEHGMTGAE